MTKKLDIFRYIQIYLEYNNLIQVNLDKDIFNLGKFRHIEFNLGKFRHI